ncbi:MAG: hypothetical protein WAX04_10455, partial [Oscillospiraceae bacterium]
MIKSNDKDKQQEKIEEEIEAIGRFEAYFDDNLILVKLPEIPVKYQKIITFSAKKYNQIDEKIALNFKSAHEDNEEISIFRIANLYENFEIPTRKLSIDVALKYYEFNIVHHRHFDSLWRYFYINFANYEDKPDKPEVAKMCSIALKIFSHEQYNKLSRISTSKECIGIYKQTFKILLDVIKMSEEKNDDKIAQKEAIKWYITNLLNAAKSPPFNDDEFNEMVNNSNFLIANNNLKIVVAKNKIDSGGDFKPGIYAKLNNEIGLTSTPNPE